jgi:thymidine kinase
MPAHPTFELYVGPMFSGKTDALIAEYRRVAAAGASAVAIKPGIDTRHPAEEIVSHSNARIPAVTVDRSSTVAVAAEDARNVFIDEVQFFDLGLPDVLAGLRSGGRRVVAAGLDLDFRRLPFETTAILLRAATQATTLLATCGLCGRPAPFTQRLLDGRPSPLDEPSVRIGDSELYEARCAECWERERA